MAIVLTYDLEETPKGIHIIVKEELTSPAYGYIKELVENTLVYRLPNTTLIHRGSKSPQAAIDDLKAVVGKYGGTITTYFSAIIGQEVIKSAALRINKPNPYLNKGLKDLLLDDND